MQRLDDLIEDFIFHCHYEKNLSDNTLKAYKIDLAQFSGFVSLNKLSRNIIKIDKNHIKGFIKVITEGSKPRTVKRKMATLKSFFNHLEFEDIIVSNPFRKIRINIQEGTQLPRTIETRTLKKLFKHVYSKKNNIAQTKGYAFSAIVRDIAVLELLFSTGLRVFELSNIKMEDIDLKSGSVKIIGKGKKERIIPICSSEALYALKEYHQLFEKEIMSEGHFFINRLKCRLSEQSVRFMIRKYAKEIESSKNITPHMFRHSVATMLLESEVDIRYIQEFLGHSSISITQIYLQVNQNASRKILKRKHPRQHMNFSTKG